MPDIKPLSLRLPDDLKPLFANVVRAAHTPGEFILDFSAVLPGMESPAVDARVILSPLGAKLLQQVLTENILRYESAFGEIRLPSPPHTLADDLFSQARNNPPDNK
ncbi:MAG: DUF3467 domain-containing protein [Chloroflexi bacterium]|jgi:hypothetical protein|nr:DUF3467 domain-containing protein [Anaerolineaceae bacterium]NLI44735.1 DUF3467 domain-containing protein [Chloroflexota bacterium]HOE34984.1 DUF3467 domain-containing protein [Anaerolineaceae bacterium]HOT25523.1 DUF3467 domain-containing protein [Anaerolineaceae bacterium]HQK03415.1 DUF3467 domain-containing protein [Anaerolineaceae bacterium]